MLNKLVNFVKRAGQYSLQVRSCNHNVDYKDDDSSILSMVTEVDVHNSAEFRKFIEQNFSDLNYMIIEEESIDDLQGKIFEKVAETEYQFIFDPIDGTINYSAGLPFYGILAAVFKGGRPLYGIIYIPAMDELIYTDGKAIFHEHGGKTENVPLFASSKSPIILGGTGKIKVKPECFNSHLLFEDYFAAAVSFFYLPLGNIKAVIGSPRIWDVAPMMAFARVLGMKSLGYYSGEDFGELSPRFWEKNGHIKETVIICFPAEYQEIKDVILSID